MTATFRRPENAAAGVFAGIAADMRRRDRKDISWSRPVNLFAGPPVSVGTYVSGGTWRTEGVYADADTAKRMSPEVGRWIQRGDDWHSEDGRTIIRRQP